MRESLEGLPLDYAKLVVHSKTAEVIPYPDSSAPSASQGGMPRRHPNIRIEEIPAYEEEQQLMQN